MIQLFQCLDRRMCAGFEAVDGKVTRVAPILKRFIHIGMPSTAAAFALRKARIDVQEVTPCRDARKQLLLFQ